jgi:hypothetical protein
MIRKSGYRLSEKIMLNRETGAGAEPRVGPPQTGKQTG